MRKASQGDIKMFFDDEPVSGATDGGGMPAGDDNSTDGEKKEEMDSGESM
ncbi:MAG: hypothetical protein HYZ51_03975 [Candidatus Doudnabacteria bacterium]|nr:hypothetical protein [Candidatus Doudnabacteria bacterium]